MDQNPNEVINQDAPTSTPAPVVSLENKPKKSHNVLFFLVGILIVLVLVGGIAGGYFLGKSNSSSNVAQIPTPTIAQDMTGSDKLTPGEPKVAVAADWNTYTAVKIPYTFKYPTEWEVLQNTNGVTVAPKEIIKIIKDQRAKGPAGGGVLDLMLIDSKDSSSVIIPKTDENKIVTTKELNIAGNKTIIYKETYIKDLPGIPKNSEINRGFIVHNGKTYVIEMQLSKSKDIFEQILSTFQFTD